MEMSFENINSSIIPRGESMKKTIRKRLNTGCSWVEFAIPIVECKIELYIVKEKNMINIRNIVINIKLILLFIFVFLISLYSYLGRFIL